MTSLLLQTDLNSTLDVTEVYGAESDNGEVQPISPIQSDSESDSDESSSNSESSDYEDPLSKTLRQNDELQKKITKLDDDLKAANDLLATSNNLKVSLKRKVEQLSTDVQAKDSVINDLRERNDMLQCLLLKAKHGKCLFTTTFALSLLSALYPVFY